MNNNEDDVPPGYRRLYLYDEFDNFISSMYELELNEYIHIVDELMTQEDATLFFDFTEEEKYDEGKKILRKYQ